METLLLVARLLLAAVFIVAGVAKLADRGGSQKALEGFGVPNRLAFPGSYALPILEVIVGVLLLPRASAQWAGIGALALLLVFVGAIGYNLARGRTPDCHCFGQIHSEPVGWSTLIRNGVLAGAAAFLIGAGWGDPGPSVVGWVDELSTVDRILAAIAVLALVGVAAEAWLLVHLLSQNGRVLLRIDAVETMVSEAGVAGAIAPTARPAAAPPPPGLPEGSPAPAFRLEGLHGETMTLDALRAAGKPVMLIFSDPNCGPCNALLPDLGKWQREYSSKLSLALITRGKPEANRSKAAEHGLSHVLLQVDREVAQLYQANGTPSAVLVRADGTIGSPVSAGVEAIRGLVARTTGTLSMAAAPVAARPAAAPQPAAPQPQPAGNGAAQAAAQPLKIAGGPAPAISLPDIDGKTVSLADFQGQSTLVLFWNPGCGFCRRMVDDIKAWEANPPPGAPKLLLVSTGEVEANKAMGLSSPIVLDQGFATGRAYGASGTPSAVLVGPDGTLASDVTVGAPGVLALANGQDPRMAANGAPSQVAPKTAAKGEPAPPVKLPDLTGKQFDLSTRRGSKTMLLFWNPGCGYCSRMVDDLKAWEASPPKGAPKMILVSTGTPEANKALGLKSTTLLDDGFNTGRAFGASGTPSAVLIDNKGNIASEVVVGAPAVMALAGAPQKTEQATA